MSIQQPTETTSKHTPGPWGVRPLEDGRIITASDGNQYIAKTLDLLDEAANARLIAAAPDLLKALDACETALAPVMASHECGDMPDSGKRCGECLGCMNWGTWQLAVSAIAKARGGAANGKVPA